HADRDADGVRLEHEEVLAHLLAEGLGEGDSAFERRLGQDDGELLAAVAGEDLVATDARLDDARELLEHEVAREVAVHVVDALEVVDVEEEDREVALVPAAADDLALERLVEVPLVVDLRETIHDGHAVDLFVILRLDVGAGEELEDRGPDLHPVAVLQDD